MTVVGYVAFAAGQALACSAGALAISAQHPVSSRVQPEVSAAPGAVSSAFADIDGDGDLDLAVSQLSGGMRLCLNGSGELADASSGSGFPAGGPGIRGRGLGDYDGDRDPDLYLTAYEDTRSRAPLFMNRGGLDLSLTETFIDGAGHRLFRNELPAADERLVAEPE